MPRIRKRRQMRRWRAPWLSPATAGPFIDHMATGGDLLNAGWGAEWLWTTPPDDIREQMAECWAAFRDAIEQAHRELHGDDARFLRPFGWWLFEAPQPVDWRTPEPLRLWRLGELTADDVREAMRRSPGGYDFAMRIARRYTTPEEQLELGIAEG